MAIFKNRISKIISIVSFTIVVFIAIIIFASASLLQHFAGSEGSKELGRSFAIDGPINIDWDWTQPNIHLSKIHLANVANDPVPNMVEIDQLDFSIRIWRLLVGELNLPEIKLTKPKIYLEKIDETHNNWDLPAFSKANAVSQTAVPHSRSSVPLIGQLIISNGQLRYKDNIRKLDMTLALDNAEGSGGNGDDAIKISGSGLLQQKSFDLQMHGGSLALLRSGAKKPYPLSIHIKMGETKVGIDGTFTDPVKMEGVNANLDLSGDNLADLFYLTQIPLPPTPHYQLSGHLSEDNKIWHFDNFKGQVGKSDLSGQLTYDTSGKRNKANADFNSNLLSMADLSGFVGASAPDKKSTDKKQEKFLPDIPIDLTRLRSSDMDVRLKAAHILAPGWPLDNMLLHITIDDGLLKIDPVSFGIADGKIEGTLILDGRENIPDVQSDLLFKRLSLKPFFKDSRFVSFSEGHMGGRLKIDGKGRSLAEVLADSNGQITAMMSGGKISELIMQAAGLNVSGAAPLLLDTDKSTDIRCAVGDFNVTDGMLNSNIFVLDTSVSNITGTTQINLKNEAIDATITSHPKQPGISANTPLTVTGYLNDPVIGLDPKELSERGIGAAALSIVLTPLGALIPFIELGLGKDSDCKGLIEQAKTMSSTKPPVP